MERKKNKKKRIKVSSNWILKNMFLIGKMDDELEVFKEVFEKRKMD